MILTSEPCLEISLNRGLRGAVVALPANRAACEVPVTHVHPAFRPKRLSFRKRLIAPFKQYNKAVIRLIPGGLTQNWTFWNRSGPHVQPCLLTYSRRMLQLLNVAQRLKNRPSLQKMQLGFSMGVK